VATARRGGSLVTTAHKEKASSHPAAAAIASIPTIRSPSPLAGGPAGPGGPPVTTGSFSDTGG